MGQVLHGSDAQRSASDAACCLAGHTGNHPAPATCAYGRPRTGLLRSHRGIMHMNPFLPLLSRRRIQAITPG